jgi:hypothetical protein
VLEGPVTRVDPDTRRLFVMDQVVRVTDDTLLSEQGQLAALGPGATVEVSGYRNAHGEVVASRIDIASPRSGHSVIGRMKQRDARTGEIGGLLVSLASGMRVEKESDVLVRGLWDGGQLRAGTIAGDPSMEMLGRVDHAVVESLVHEPRRGDRLRVGMLQVRVTKATRIDGAPAALRIDQSVQVTGVPDRRSGLAAERIRITPAGRIQPLADRRPRPGDERAEKERRDSSPEPGRPERMERLEALAERAEPARVERSEPTRVERTEPTRVERPEPIRLELRIERPEKAQKPEKVEKPERSGSNGGRG